MKERLWHNWVLLAETLAIAWLGLACGGGVSPESVAENPQVRGAESELLADEVINVLFLACVDTNADRQCSLAEVENGPIGKFGARLYVLGGDGVFRPYEMQTADNGIDQLKVLAKGGVKVSEFRSSVPQTEILRSDGWKLCNESVYFELEGEMPGFDERTLRVSYVFDECRVDG